MEKNEKRKLRVLQLNRGACINEPKAKSFVVENGHFVLTVRKIDGVINTSAAELFCVPDTAEITLGENDCTYRWESHADTIFNDDGIMNFAFGDSYEMRTAQLYGARLVQRAIEMGEQVAIEAPTGTGKSLLSLAVAIRMGLTVVVSTSNKALQQQLYRKDVPLMLEHLNPMGTVVLVQGKRNYLCLRDAYVSSPDGLSRKALSLFTDDALLNDEYETWANATTTGNLTDAPFDMPDKAANTVVVPDSCDGKDCDHIESCFYYEMKRQRKSAQVIICNHALLTLNELYPNAGILPHTKLLVIDEAHNLESFVRSAQTKEFSLYDLRKRVDDIFEIFGEGHDCTIGPDRLDYNDDADDGEILITSKANVLGEVDAIIHWIKKIANRRNEADIELIDRVFPSKVEKMLTLAASTLSGSSSTGDKKADRDRQKAANRLQNAGENMGALCVHDENIVRWITQPKSEDTGRYHFGEGVNCVAAPIYVGHLVRRIAGVSTVLQAETPEVHDVTRCHRCNRELNSATVHVLAGYPYGPKCILEVDPNGDAEMIDLAEWLDNPEQPEIEEVSAEERSTRATVFTSATLTSGGKFDKLFRGWGVEPKTKFIATSPFPFLENCAVYIPSATTPIKSDFDNLVEFLSREIWRLVSRSNGGAFLLFTANARLHACKDYLRSMMEEFGLEVLVQGEQGKQYIANRFKENPNCVLFATRTFFEGISIDGPNLRLVTMDSMPFKPPSPLGTAVNLKARKEMVQIFGMTEDEAKWWAFDNEVCADMRIDLKQAFGRLIRTMTDKGVFAMLDSKARATRFGRTAIDELPEMNIVYDIDGKTGKLIADPNQEQGGTDTENYMSFMSK